MTLATSMSLPLSKEASVAEERLSRTPKTLMASQDQTDIQLNRIKLLKFVTTFSIGGTERQVNYLGRALDPSRFELRFACLRRWGHFLKDIETRGIPVTQYRITSLYNYSALKEQVRFARHLRRDRIEILHTYGFYCNVFAISAARLMRVPIIVASIRDRGAGLTLMQRRVHRVMCHLADSILANADAVRQWLIEEGYDPAKITVIRNGIDLSPYARTDAGARLRQELGLPARAPLVAVVGRLHPLKGIEYFLEAAAIVSGRFQEARFLVVGERYTDRGGVEVKDGSYRRELARYATRLGLDQRVVFTGIRLDTAELLSEVAVSVLPSLSEGLSNVLLESMAARVPVVATRVGGNPEVVEDGVTGLLVPPSDSAALAQAICRLLENPHLASQFGQAGRQRVAERFSLERMVQETERLYQKLLTGSRLRAAGAREGTRVRGSAHETRQPD